jgi:hypothetical protein
MLALHLVGLIGSLAASLTLGGAAYAQASTRNDDEYKPPIYRPRTERDYEPWPTQRKSTATPKKSTPAPKTQAAKTAPPPAEVRDPALARCDQFKKRMEQVIREEQRGGDPVRMQRLGEERKKVYQDTMRAGC